MTMFEENDWRYRLKGTVFVQPLCTPEDLPRNVEMVEELRALACDPDTSLAPLAIAGVLRDPIVVVALSGTRRPRRSKRTCVRSTRCPA